MSGSQWTEGRSEDRLPWLESADGDYSRRGSFGRVILLVLLALGLIAAAIYAFGWLQSRPTASGTGELIEAQEGDYKVKPDEPGGMKAQGEGDTVFATSEGGAPKGRVDLSAIPEAPIAAVKGTAGAAAAPVQGKGGTRVVAPVPASKGALTAAAPARAGGANRPETASDGTLVQLGSFPSEGGANAEWTMLSKRFGYLAPLTKSVERAEVNGATVYRLRVGGGSNAQARDLCARLKVAGEACFVVR
ncbi:SPOR domain-containing protein [Sphingomonas japonica]|uniref:SPOR domain-containing protein n=1 Tax=Sphingomonas japonica TaxID=511662 RepID=A0ABX0TWX7_9SPHN|nr:SPOR domain-containing protein [Sphingomonas japonica]NIJ22815.1 hypothetical protein [Sphingomonas japonica]